MGIPVCVWLDGADADACAKATGTLARVAFWADDLAAMSFAARSFATGLFWAPAVNLRGIDSNVREE